ncbi:winged helix-turn-helix transcriptional regulator [Prevotella sp. kh1p2]|uniref:winged helix-turn-helix transcriptional regulator n=1 Tax=Prevotella sp. kh1p2 TaxID=1761883 RepID=UPI0008BF5C30|nr:helix-turn-helix domain-containing protein [Prevotella sp. kh1p2]SES83570.1 transcriptional regulator, HxlR family [Prevotella sp. kh1p2]SNU10804.1 transcriptional regulator, HxlR family [Prevotellaceae bacterium KH2P17]
MNRNNITDPLFPECPIRNILSRIGEKWTLLVLLELSESTGSMRFGQIARAIPDVSQRMLTATLRALEADGLVSRKVYPEVPLRVEYALTERTHTLIPLINQLVQWSIDNYKGIIEDRKRFVVR